MAARFGIGEVMKELQTLITEETTFLTDATEVKGGAAHDPYAARVDRSDTAAANATDGADGEATVGGGHVPDAVLDIEARRDAIHHHLNVSYEASLGADAHTASLGAWAWFDVVAPVAAATSGDGAEARVWAPAATVRDGANAPIPRDANYFGQPPWSHPNLAIVLHCGAGGRDNLVRNAHTGWLRHVRHVLAADKVRSSGVVVVSEIT